MLIKNIKFHFKYKKNSLINKNKIKKLKLKRNNYLKSVMMSDNVLIFDKLQVYQKFRFKSDYADS